MQGAIPGAKVSHDKDWLCQIYFGRIGIECSAPTIGEYGDESSIVRSHSVGPTAILLRIGCPSTVGKYECRLFIESFWIVKNVYITSLAVTAWYGPGLFLSYQKAVWYNWKFKVIPSDDTDHVRARSPISLTFASYVSKVL